MSFFLEHKLYVLQVAYIYPDYTTAILGTFEDGVLVSGRSTSIKSISLQKVNHVHSFYFLATKFQDVFDFQGVVVPVFKACQGPLLEREIANQAIHKTKKKIMQKI